METLIHNALKTLSDQRQIKIIYACESGSRTWGFSSLDSDYDVRFIYVRPVDWYLSINVENKKDVIEYTSPDGQLDMVGWDLRKACKLLYKSNPPLIEWLVSPVVYFRDPAIEKLIQIAQLCYNRQNAYYHYYHMAKNNFGRHLTIHGQPGELHSDKIEPEPGSETRNDASLAPDSQSDSSLAPDSQSDSSLAPDSQSDSSLAPEGLVRAKKYFCVLRPLFAIEWINQSDLIVPTKFEDLLASSIVPETVRNEITQLLAQKRINLGVFTVPFNKIINDFIVEKLASAKPTFVTQPVDIELVNKVFQQIIQAVSSELEVTPLAKHVKDNIQPRLSKDADGLYVMPNPQADFEHFMGLHSWYKHFRDRTVNIYPMLEIGQERRNEFDGDYKNDNQLHWRFFVEDYFEDYMVDMFEDNSPPINMVPDKYFQVNHLFGNYSPNDLCLKKFNVKCMEKTCEQVWEVILNHCSTSN